MCSAGSSRRTFVVRPHMLYKLLFNYWIPLPPRSHCHSFNSPLCFFHPLFLSPVLDILSSQPNGLPCFFTSSIYSSFKPHHCSSFLLCCTSIPYLLPFLHARLLLPSGYTVIWDGRWLICGPIRHKQTFGHLPPELLPCCSILSLPLSSSHKDNTSVSFSIVIGVLRDPDHVKVKRVVYR